MKAKEITIKVKDHHLDVVEIPITARYDIENISTKNPVAHGIGVLNSVIGLIAEKRPLLFFGVAGVVFATIRLILGANVFSIANMGRGMSKYIYILIIGV